MTDQDVLHELRDYRKNHAILTIRAEDENALQRCNQVKAWLRLLPKDERLIVQKHIIEGLDWTRTSAEFDRIWGYENGRSERTMKRKQAVAIRRIREFMNNNIS